MQPSFLSGVAVAAINEKEINHSINSDQPLKNFLGTAYTTCLMSCVAECGKWVTENCPPDTKVTYFFEQGHRHEGEASRFLRGANNHPILRDRYHIGGYGFYGKRDVRLLQTADLLAWEWHKWNNERLNNQKRPMRKSLVSLLEKPHRYFFFNKNNIGLQAMHLRSYGFAHEK